MKQIIPFVKDISFNTDISEITSIALEHNLQMENADSIVGNFTISGKYKINDISVNEEVFEKEVPFDITLDDKYDASKVKIDIDNFYYEIINDEYLRVHIDVLVQNLVYVKKEVKMIDEVEKPELVIPDVPTYEDKKNEERSDDLVENEKEVIKTNEEREKENILEEKNSNNTKENIEISENDIVEENRENIASNISASFLNETEKYVTYKVHIIRENETIDDIKEKYGIDKEELEKYNSLDNIVIGSKIIIPTNNE